MITLRVPTEITSHFRCELPSQPPPGRWEVISAGTLRATWARECRDNVRVMMMLGLLFVLAGTATRATEYYLAPDGQDDAAGSREAPWRTIAKANEALTPGDSAIFLPGEYAGSIRPARSGTTDAPITYRSAEFRAARLVPGQDAELIRLEGHEQMVISGFTVDGQHRANWAQITDCRHITISGCEMRRNPRTMLVLASSQVRLLDNVLSADRLRGDMLHLRDSNELLFEGNSTTRAGHCPLRIHNCFNVAVRANVFRCEWGRNYEFWRSARLLIEGNIVTRARDSGGSADSRAKNLYDDSIFRQNLVFGNLHTPMNSGSYIWRGVSRASPHWRGPFVAVNSRFYHNTIADNLGHGWEIYGINVSSNVFQNNIFYRNDYAGGGTQVLRGDSISRDNRFVTNILRGVMPNQNVVRYGTNNWTAEEANRNTPTTGGFWSEFQGNLDADPAFADCANRDYRLTAGSAAIDAGTPLAWAMGAGTSRALPVSDGRWFYDGFGIEGEKGDWIAVGAGDNLAQVERVELRYYQPAVLHLDREVTWEDAMPVSLPWSGAAPDLGALPHGTSHPTQLIALARPAAVEPGAPVTFSLDTFGKQLQTVTWDFEDGAVSHEPTPTHTFDQAGHYGVTVRTVFASGQRGVAAVFVHVPERLDAAAPLVEVDFEDATRGDTWGYHFKFYRPHQTNAAHVARPDGTGKCMHIFYDAKKSNRTAGQIAPGAWDIDRYPMVRFQYRIPAGVPLAVQLNPFEAPERPRSFVLAGTPNQANRFGALDGYTLVDDGQWHEITMDVRRLRKLYPELQHLRQFLFSTPWASVSRPRQWLHFPALQSQFTSQPAEPEDVAHLHSVDTLMLRARQAGAWLQMPFTLNEQVTGELFVDLLDHNTRGMVRILLNGEAIVEQYEHFNEGTVRSSVSLGQMTLSAAEHTVRVEVLEQRVGFVGLVGVTIHPEGAPAEPRLALEDFQFWFDQFAILPDTGE